MNGWQGLFPAKNEVKTNGKSGSGFIKIEKRWIVELLGITDPTKRYRKFAEFDDPERYDLSDIGLENGNHYGL